MKNVGTDNSAKCAEAGGSSDGTQCIGSNNNTINLSDKDATEQDSN